MRKFDPLIGSLAIAIVMVGTAFAADTGSTPITAQVQSYFDITITPTSITAWDIDPDTVPNIYPPGPQFEVKVNKKWNHDNGWDVKANSGSANPDGWMISKGAEKDHLTTPLVVSAADGTGDKKLNKEDVILYHQNDKGHVTKALTYKQDGSWDNPPHDDYAITVYYTLAATA